MENEQTPVLLDKCDETSTLQTAYEFATTSVTAEKVHVMVFGSNFFMQNICAHPQI